ncbi:MAG: GldG family protein, partial [Alphaproteobacteria bacterium]|nr:GldG family protein [Alphaproteobacteria bacterium]
MKPVPRRTFALVALVLAAVIFVALNIAADTGLTGAKLDLTANGQFTLSEGTRHIVANLKEPVTLKFYFSKQVAAEYAQTVAYAKRVRDLLGEYASASGGKVIVQEIDPEPFTEAEDKAQAEGLTGAPTDSGDTVFFGLVGTNRIDGKEA